MAAKSKARRPKKAAKKKMTKAEQSERFIKTAREIGVDESGGEFDTALRKIVPPKPAVAQIRPVAKRASS
jgi:hypothetical protein